MTTTRPEGARPRVGVVMGSTSDWATLRHASDTLAELGIPHECEVVSAHRTPERLRSYALGAAERGLEAVIAGAGGAAHLPGMLASWTLLPVLGVPVESRVLRGVDSLLSIVQMPAGVPVGTLAIGEAGRAERRAARREDRSRSATPAFAPLAARRDDDAARVAAAGLLDERARSSRAPRSGVLGGGQLGRMFTVRGGAPRLPRRTSSPPTTTRRRGRSPAARSGRLRRPRRGRSLRALGLGRHVRVRERPAGDGAGRGAARARAARRARARHDPGPACARRQRSLASDCRFPPMRRSSSAADLERADAAIPGPSVLKTAAWGYDGKGQRRLAGAPSCPTSGGAWGAPAPSSRPSSPSASELSVVGARGSTARSRSTSPSRTSTRTTSSTSPSGPRRSRPRRARSRARDRAAVLEGLDVVGVLCVEIFELDDGRLLVNELAPRPHNSGHLTIDAHALRPVRAAGARGLRAAARLRRAARARRRDGEPARRPLGERRRRTGPPLLARRGCPSPPVRQGGRPPRPEDGAPVTALDRSWRARSRRASRSRRAALARGRRRAGEPRPRPRATSSRRRSSSSRSGCWPP